MLEYQARITNQPLLDTDTQLENAYYAVQCIQGQICHLEQVSISPKGIYTRGIQQSCQSVTEFDKKATSCYIPTFTTTETIQLALKEDLDTLRFLLNRDCCISRRVRLRRQKRAFRRKKRRSVRVNRPPFCLFLSPQRGHSTSLRDLF